MKSTLTKLFDHRAEPVPEKMTRWRIPDGEIGDQLALLARAHAETLSVETAEPGDAVRCVCTGGTPLPDRKNVLLYPGKDLPGAEEAEAAAVGKRRGEEFSAAINGTPLTLRVEEICRCCCPPPVDDALVRLEKLDGVNTLEDYARWYRDRNEPARRREAAQRIAGYWLRQIAEKSEFTIDEAERQEWALVNARLGFQSMKAAGEDPCIPENGVDFLTEEEAIARMAKQQLPRFRTVLAARYLAGRQGAAYGEEVLESTYRQLAGFLQCTPEEARKEVPAEILLDNVYMSKASELLSDEAADFLEV